MIIALYGPAAFPFLAALIALVLPWRLASYVGALAALSTLGSGMVLAQSGEVAHGLVRADALTAWMLIAVGAVATIACTASIGHLRHESGSGAMPPAAARRYVVLVQLFLACMCLAVLADNLGLLWVAVEGTTIVTAFLVGHRRTRQSIEAAWKYVVLCSIGIGIAFLGTVCFYAAAVATGAHGLTALDWTYLTAHAHELNPDLIRLAAGLVLLGFGTKAGLAPMHSWLPDAHSQAPAPVSALMSGVLLSVSFYAILRFKTITDAVIGPGYTRALLLVAAFASLAVAAVLLIAQRDYKRLLAYSSIEHMGLIALGAAIGGRLALAAVLLHVLGHGMAKAVAFCAAGTILHRTGSSNIDDARGLGAAAPVTAGVFGLSLLALLAFPPFSLFASELGIARAGIDGGYGWAVAIGFVLVLVAFTAIARHAGRMLLGAGGGPLVGPHRAGLVPLVAGLAGVAVLGMYLGPLQQLLDAAATAAGGR